jgi:four helix bundle protein
MGNINSFEDLECWKASRELRMFVSGDIIPKFPLDEKFALTSQLRRSSRSVGDNIAEGFGRYNHQENIQACRIARGSLCEALNQVVTATDENYIDNQTLDEFRLIFEKTKAILNGYINYLKKAKGN